MFESRISAVWIEKLPYSHNFRISSWSYDMAGHAKKCLERYCELAHKTTQQHYKVSTPCIDDHHFKEEETKSIGEMSQVCSQTVLKCLYLARIGRVDILWSVNKLARSITKWTKACDKCLNRLISYIHHICEQKQYCHVGNTVIQCGPGLFQDSDFAGDLEDYEIHFWRNTVHFRKSYICSNKLDVQETNCCFAQLNRIWNYFFEHWTEIRWFCLLWNYGIFLFLFLEMFLVFQIDQGNLIMMFTNVISLKRKWMWWNTLILFLQMFNPRVKKLYCTCSKTEAVIKMIIKGRSPTMRHVSRTHRVALDWLFDQINLDPKPKSNTSTKGHFTRDEWNHLLNLLNISQFFCCNGKTISTRFRRRTSHSKILWCILLRGRYRSCLLQLHWAWWRDTTENKILGDLLLQMIDQGNLIKSTCQKVADSTIFMGSDAAEFVNKVNDQILKQTEKNVERCRMRRRTFNNLENVYGCYDECSDIHGKEFSR